MEQVWEDSVTKTHDVVHCHTLIIGAGGAGVRSAIEASRFHILLFFISPQLDTIDTIEYNRI